MHYSYIDMHCDTLLRCLASNNSQTLYSGDGMQSICQMKEAGQMCQFFAVFFPPRDFKKKNELQEEHEFPKDELLWEMLTTYLKHEVVLHENEINMARNAIEIEKNFQEGKMSAVLTIEDGRIVQGKMERLTQLKKEGVCAISLTWNQKNCFGFPNSQEANIMQTGLTSFGKEAIEVMNNEGILIDVSHLSDGGFWDVSELSKKPFIATHSNSRELSPHTRNLTNEMIRAIAEKGGVIGLNFGAEFLTTKLDNSLSKVEDLVRQIYYIARIGGEDVIALGTDFDGIHGSFEVGHPKEMEKLFRALKKRGMTEKQLDKFSSQNVLRVMHSID